MAIKKNLCLNFQNLSLGYLSKRLGKTKQWATREKELEKVLFSTIELYGDFDGILGGSLKSIKGIDPPAIEEG